MNLTVSVSTKEQLIETLSSDASSVYMESTIGAPGEWGNLSELVRSAGKKPFLALPHILRTRAERYLSNESERLKQGFFDGYLLRNTESVLFLKEHRISGSMISDHSIYIWNKEAVSVLKELGFTGFTSPVELSGRELGFLPFDHTEVIVYGFLPMMITANCLKKTASDCDRKESVATLVDRGGRRMSVRKECRYCYNILYNSVPLSLADRIKELYEIGVKSVRLCFTVESGTETARILSVFKKAIEKPSDSVAFTERFTRAHFDRGIL